MPHGNRISKSNQHPQRPQDQLDTEEGTLKSATHQEQGIFTIY